MFPIPWNYPFRKKDGTVVNMEDAGGGGGGGYVLPPATASTLGGIKVGDGLSVESDGTLSASGGGGGGGNIKVHTWTSLSNHDAGTDVYLAGDSMSSFGMAAGDTLIGIVPASGHCAAVRGSTASSGAGKKYSDITTSDTMWLYADLKYADNASNHMSVNFIYLTS